MRAWAVGVLLLAGCGENSQTVDLQGALSAGVSYTDGMSFSTRYAFIPAEQSLLGIWSKRDSQGSRSTDKDRNLSEEEASELRELIESIRLSEPSQPGECWEDTASLTFLLRDAGGMEHRYPTDPERQACNEAELFANKGDVQAFLDACRALLPEPIL
jgi:hypothetical protein